MKELRSVRCSPSGASVPPFFSRVGTIVARGDISKSTLANEGAVDQRVEESNRVPKFLVHQCDETGPQRCYRTRPTDHELLSIDADDVARSRVRVPSDIRSTAAPVATGVC